VTRYLLDSNHLGALLHPQSRVFDRFDRQRRSGDRFGTIVPVLCEVDAGLAGRIEHERCLALMKKAASFVRIWPQDPSVAQVFGDFFVRLRRAGRVLSHVDLLLAAVAQSERQALLRDFETIPELKCENWLI
jgi:predicted nucleic acid-binding protein